MENMFKKEPFKTGKKILTGGLIFASSFMPAKAEAGIEKNAKDPEKKEAAAEKVVNETPGTTHYETLRKKWTYSAEEFKFHADEVAAYFEKKGDNQRAEAMRKLESLPKIISQEIHAIVDDPHNAHIDFSKPENSSRLIQIVLSSKAITSYEFSLSGIMNGTSMGGYDGSGAKLDKHSHDYFASAIPEIVKTLVADLSNHQPKSVAQN